MALARKPTRSSPRSSTSEAGRPVDLRLLVGTVVDAVQTNLDGALPAPHQLVVRTPAHPAPALVDVVKIDVEGHEEAVVEALMASAHRDRIAAIFYEVDERWTDGAAIARRLGSAGFGLWTLLSRYVAPIGVLFVFWSNL